MRLRKERQWLKVLFWERESEYEAEMRGGGCVSVVCRPEAMIWLVLRTPPVIKAASQIWFPSAIREMTTWDYRRNTGTFSQKKKVLSSIKWTNYFIYKVLHTNTKIYGTYVEINFKKIVGRDSNGVIRFGGLGIHSLNSVTCHLSPVTVIVIVIVIVRPVVHSLISLTPTTEATGHSGNSGFQATKAAQAPQATQKLRPLWPYRLLCPHRPLRQLRQLRPHRPPRPHRPLQPLRPLRQLRPLRSHRLLRPIRPLRQLCTHTQDKIF